MPTENEDLNQSVTINLDESAGGKPTAGGGDAIDQASQRRERSPSERSLKSLLERERQGRAEAERQRDVARQEAAAAQYQRHNAQLDGLLNAIGAAQGEADAAEAELREAHAMNDASLIAKAQRKLSEATSRKVQYESQKQIFDQRTHQVRQQPQRAYGIEDALANMTGLMGVEQDWLRKNPDLVLDQNKNRRLTTYFDEAVERGLERGSQDFLNYMEGRLGMRGSSSKRSDNGSSRRQADHDDGPRYAAPPSRGSGLDLDMSDVPTSITLNPSEREAARMAGISEAEYAAQKRILIARKRSGFYDQ